MHFRLELLLKAVLIKIQYFKLSKNLLHCINTTNICDKISSNLLITIYFLLNKKFYFIILLLNY